MKILTLSDTHGLHNRIPKAWFVDADIIMHSGDCTNQGYITEIELFLKWYNSLNYTYKILIAGNHDFGFEEKPDRIKDVLLEYPDIIYLQDSGVEIEGIKIYGSPQTPYFHNWAFNCARNQQDSLAYDKPLIKTYWDKIPKDTQILITHGPPHGINDFVPYNGGEFTGCKDLLEVVYNLPDLKMHLHGHIHCGYGEQLINGVHYINASTCNERYEPVQNPILFEI